MRFNSVLASKFRGCEQIGYLDDPHVGRHLRVYKLPQSLLNEGEEDLVGINDGSSTWIASKKHSLFGMKSGISPAFPKEQRPRAVLQSGGRARKSLQVDAPAKSSSRRRLLHAH